MEISFKSFKEIVNESLPLIKKPKDDFWAHIDGIEKNTETLYEHLDLVSQYFLKIVDANQIEPIIEQLIIAIVNEISIQDQEKVTPLLKEIFTNAIIYHDLGKVNPNFQIKLKNPAFKNRNLSFASQHSVPGAFLFCAFYIEKLLKEKFTQSDTNTILIIILFLSNPITRHHSSYIDIKQELESFPVDELLEFLNDYQIDLDTKILKGVFSNNSFNLLYKHLKNHSNSKAFFSIYCLVKLNFSLLTASDYYATGDYMSGMKVNQFGLISKDLKDKIDYNFKALKSYNKELFKNFDQYLRLNFDQLQEKSGDNLNSLRQKLNAEVISELRKKPTSNWYYIEAPTGAGKTNLSLACINELLGIDASLNKVIYVFPFTTLITQTFMGIKETIGITNDDLIQLHSKGGLHEKESKEDGVYGNDKYNYIDYLFANYPFTVTTHVNFFDILQGNSKSSNYLFHRLSNSIVILDEIQ
jgi:CRISPR-associated endonuclease/helicase Cas3